MLDPRCFRSEEYLPGTPGLNGRQRMGEPLDVTPALRPESCSDLSAAVIAGFDRRASKESAIAAHDSSLVGIIYNPISGNGSSKEKAYQAKAFFEQHGYRVAVLESKRSYQSAELATFLERLEFVVVAGGDGTLMPLLPAVAAARTPIYVLPTGTESHFSKQFEMSSSFDEILSRAKSKTQSTHCYGTVSLPSPGAQLPFFLMASVGLDAEVVKHISQKRSSPIGHIGYVWPTISCAFRHFAPKISLAVDGNKVLGGEAGYLIIANSHKYALGLNLVPEAKTAEPELCARFFPRHGFDLGTYAHWGWRYLANKAADMSGTKLFYGRRFELTVEDRQARQDGYPMQADGEYIGGVFSEDPVVIQISSDKLNVMK